MADEGRGVGRHKAQSQQHNSGHRSSSSTSSRAAERNGRGLTIRKLHASGLGFIGRCGGGGGRGAAESVICLKTFRGIALKAHNATGEVAPSALRTRPIRNAATAEVHAHSHTRTHTHTPAHAHGHGHAHRFERVFWQNKNVRNGAQPQQNSSQSADMSRGTRQTGPSQRVRWQWQWQWRLRWR
jgi:hypothetical protein